MYVCQADSRMITLSKPVTDELQLGRRDRNNDKTDDMEVMIEEDFEWYLKIIFMIVAELFNSTRISPPSNSSYPCEWLFYEKPSTW